MKKLLGGWSTNEGRDVHIDKGGHEELAVKAVQDSTMAGDDVPKILFDIPQCFLRNNKRQTEWACER